jgi:hypothetical protein
VFNIQITIIIFNRPKETKALLDCLSEIKPKTLYVISDGPRPSQNEDISKVKATRDLINTIDWECNITKLYSDQNMGCMMRVSSGLSLVFDKEKYSIILEDDCIPNNSFFKFSAEMLIKYEHDCRIMSISGTRLASDIQNQEYSYSFSKYSICWGWSTWSRAWKLYNHDLTNLDINFQNHYLKSHLGGIRQELYWKYILKKLHKGKINSWAYRWMYSSWVNNGLSITPKVNTVTNIGSGAEATHTTDMNAFLHKTDQKIAFPLAHPTTVQCDYIMDSWIEDKFYSKSFLARFRWLANKLPFIK